jgi:phospholipase D1/2
MSTNAPADGGSKPEHLRDRIKHDLEHMREKFQDTKLYDLKVALSHKKWVRQAAAPSPSEHG